MTETHKVLADGRCSCCLAYVTTTGGCTKCNSQRTYCVCGTLVLCGCGAHIHHRCNVVLISGQRFNS